MNKLPDLPAWLKPYIADELKREERSIQAALRRGEAAFGDDGLIAHYRAKGDPLLEFANIILLVIAAMPEKTPAGLVHLFVLSTKMGQFPTPGAGLGPLDRVTDLFDFYHLRAASDDDFSPTLLMVEGAPLAMQACRSVWVIWLRSLSLTVHPLLAHGLTMDHEPDNRAISAADHRAQTADHPIPNPALPRGVGPPNQRPLPSRRGNAAYDDTALVAGARELRPTLQRQSNREAAKAAVEEFIEQNPGKIKEGAKQTTIDRIRRKM